MEDSPLAVLRWPALVDPRQELLIATVNTKNTQIRESARQQVRVVLREILGDIAFESIPGQPIRLVQAASPLGISVSHEAGLSLLAIHRAGPVGVDLLRVQENPDWEVEIPALANDYLGPDAADNLAILPQSQKLMAFAQAWSAHEARLKSRGLGLEEWSSALAAHLAPCRVRQLALPAGYIGAVATLTAGESPDA